MPLTIGTVASCFVLPSPTPTKTPTPTPTKTPTPTPTPTKTLTPTPTKTSTVTPTATLVPTSTPTPTVTPTKTLTPTPTITPSVTVTPSSPIGRVATKIFDVGNSTSDSHIACFIKRASGSETQIQFTQNGVSIPKIIAWVLYISGINQTNFTNTIGTPYIDGSSSNTAIPSAITTTSDNCLVFAAAYARSMVGSYSINGSNWPSVVNDTQTDSSNTTSYATKIQSTLGTTSDITFTSSNIATRQIALQWALTPDNTSVPPQINNTQIIKFTASSSGNYAFNLSTQPSFGQIICVIVTNDLANNTSLGTTSLELF